MTERDAIWGDRLLAAGLVVGGQAEFWFDRPAGAVLAAEGIPTGMCFLLLTAVLLARRRWPFATVAVASGAFLLGTLFVESRVDSGPIAVYVALIVAFYSAGASGASRGTFTQVVRTPALLWIAILLLDETRGVFDVNGPAQPVAVGILAVAWVVGHEIGTSRQRATILRQQALALEAQQDALTQVAVAEERARLARELHDVISHNVSVMVVQAQAGAVVAGSDRQFVDAFTAIERHGREALDELRRMLGVLRETSAEVPHRPQPGLGWVPELIEGLQAAGLDISLHVSGSPEAVPPVVGLSAYRILQEATTNVLKHARSATAEVVLECDGDRVRLEVRNDVTDDEPHSTGAGMGLRTMQERAALCGGQVQAGPHRAGGFAVVATLPFGGAA